jgi:hypothetical protein
VCGESPTCEIEPVNIGAIDDPTDAAVSRRKRRVGAGKGQEKGQRENRLNTGGVVAASIATVTAEAL